MLTTFSSGLVGRGVARSLLLRFTSSGLVHEGRRVARVPAVLVGPIKHVPQLPSHVGSDLGRPDVVEPAGLLLGVLDGLHHLEDKTLVDPARNAPPCRASCITATCLSVCVGGWFLLRP